MYRVVIQKQRGSFFDKKNLQKGWRAPNKKYEKDFSAYKRGVPAIFPCPECGLEQAIEKHYIHRDGSVSPMCKCPGCKQEFHIVLQNWCNYQIFEPIISGIKNVEQHTRH